MVDSNETGPPWDADFATALVGSRVLVGLTYCTASGTELRREQVHGVVSSAELETGITLKLQGVREGETINLPPHTDAFEPADPATYTLKSTGEEVIDPDYLATWTITAPD